MTVPDFETKVGDYGKLMTGTLKGPGGAAVNLSGSTVAFSMRKRDSATFVVEDAPVTVVSAPAGTFSYEFQAPELDEQGTFRGEMVVSTPDGEVTFPSDGTFTIEVNPRL